MSTVNRRKGVDELLAAPASVRDDPEELRKYRERKAAIEAAANKRASAKKKQPPTTEDLLADIVRVATDPLTNPWHEYSSISRKRYRLFGWSGCW